MSEIILLKDVEGIYVQWMFGDFKLFDGNLEVSAVGKRNDKDGVTYLVHYAGEEKDWRFGMASDELRLERRELTPATEQPATAPDGGGEAAQVDETPLSERLENYRAIFHDVIDGHLSSSAPVMAKRGLYLLKHSAALEADNATLRAQLAAAEATAAGLREIANDYRDQVWVHQGTLRVIKGWLNKDDGFSAENGFTWSTMLGMVERDLEASEKMDTRTLIATEEIDKRDAAD